MVWVGLKRYLDHQQREEIRAQLRQKHAIKLSSGEISRLARQFLAYLSRLHYSHAEPLKAALVSDGGWPMHVDATGESGYSAVGRLPRSARNLYCPACRIQLSDLELLVQRCGIWAEL
jgi:hypothetical protein